MSTNEFKYDTLVFVGRFQPFHNGHKEVVQTALSLSKKVIILIGSSNVARSMRNPFTFDERRRMILTSIYKYADAYSDINPRLIIKPLGDYTYNDTLWVQSVQQIVKECNPGERVGLIGCDKDHSSFYLKLFPNWGSENVEFVNPISATMLRTLYWTYGTGSHWVDDSPRPQSQLKKFVPPEVFEFLVEFYSSDEYKYLNREISFIEKYKESVKKYPRFEQTVDAVVIQSGHVLLVRRRSEPGKGMWALPGGFVNPEEKLEEAMLRELREETGIKVPLPVLKGNIVCADTFDDPHRSARARIITRAFLIKLPDATELPKVKGSSDADKATWVPLADLEPTQLFEDHFFIIQKLVGEM